MTRRQRQKWLMARVAYRHSFRWIWWTLENGDGIQKAHRDSERFAPGSRQ